MIKKLKENYIICFNDKPHYTDYVFENKYMADNAVYLEVNGEIVSQLFLVYKKLYIRGVIVDCPYISGLCTLPQYRNKGYADIVMNKAFDRLKIEGFTLCALHPFRHDFYEKLGFVTYTKVKKYTVRYCGGNSLTLKDADLTDIPLLKSLYNNFMRNKHGYVYRDALQTENRLMEMKASGECKIIFSGGRAAGYMYYDNSEIEEYCADKMLLDKIVEVDGSTVYLPYTEDLGDEENFTMIKLLDRKNFLKKSGIDEKIFLNYDDIAVIHAVMGSYADFNFKLPLKLKAEFSDMPNYVFDKY